MPDGINIDSVVDISDFVRFLIVLDSLVFPLP